MFVTVHHEKWNEDWSSYKVDILLIFVFLNALTNTFSDAAAADDQAPAQVPQIRSSFVFSEVCFDL